MAYWLVEANTHDWDEYDSFVIRAKTADEAHLIAVLETVTAAARVWPAWTQGEMKGSKQVWSVHRLDDVDGVILCSSFNAG